MAIKFNIPNETMVITSSYITEGFHPVLEVSREDNEEGGSLWQFHSGNGDYSMEKMQLVRLDTILTLDPTVVEVADLPMGKTAERSAQGAPWTIK
jgi:hypothetical protein